MLIHLCVISNTSTLTAACTNLSQHDNNLGHFDFQNLTDYFEAGMDPRRQWWCL